MRFFLPALVSSLAVACAGSSFDEPAVPLTLPSRLCGSPGEAVSCVDARDVEHWLGRSHLEILEATDTPQGRQGARVLTLRTNDGRGRVVFRAKWRAHDTSHALNVPFREVAAHAVQKLFLPSEEWVVPPSATTCFELDAYRKAVDEKAQPSLRGTRCVFGVVSYWLEQGSGLKDVFDERLFWQSGTYRRSLANVNLTSFLIDHGDSHPAQFIATGSEDDPRVHLVDNTIAFSDFRNPKIPPASDFSRLQVPALSRASVERLMALSAAELAALRVIEQYELRSGELVRQNPDLRLSSRRANLAWSGGKLSLGLTDAEIARLSRRVQEISELVRQGRVRTFD